MQLPQLRMESTFARIEILQTNASLEIRQPKVNLQIEQPPAEVTMRTKPGRLTIDQTQAFEETNLMSVMKLNKQHSEAAVQHALAGVARIAREGRELMEIEHGTNAIAAQEKRRYNPPPKELGIKFIPSTFAVKTYYEPAEVQIDVKTNPPKIHVETFSPQFTYRPGSVETRLAERNRLDITVE